DGGRIAFGSERNGATNVYVLEVANGSVSRLSTGPGTDGEPAWLGDGRLVYVNWTDGVPRLCWLDPAAPASVHAIDLGPGRPARARADHVIVAARAAARARCSNEHGRS